MPLNIPAKAFRLMPLWMSRVLSNGGIINAIMRHSGDYDSYGCCLVGEAHGFNSAYQDSCHECLEFSQVRSMVFDSDEKTTVEQAEQEWLDRFLDHWCEVHDTTE